MRHFARRGTASVGTPLYKPMADGGMSTFEAFGEQMFRTHLVIKVLSLSLDCFNTKFEGIK